MIITVATGDARDVTVIIITMIVAGDAVDVVMSIASVFLFFYMSTGTLGTVEDAGDAQRRLSSSRSSLVEMLGMRSDDYHRCWRCWGCVVMAVIISDVYHHPAHCWWRC